MITCRTCGKRKKVQRLSLSQTEGEGSTCTKARQGQKGVIAWAGCGRTPSLRAHKRVRCKGYTCSLGGCKQNPAFKLPIVPEGDVGELVVGAAGGFSGYRLKRASPEEAQAVARAKAIRDAAFGPAREGAMNDTRH